jgi:crotonobetainyl-CoA:carnitine CoA-transferase CaiB-like acyl-CoA transferase
MTNPPLRVLDLTDPLGFQAARLLVGIGADVVRVEIAGSPEPSAAEQWHWHAGKRTLRAADPEEADTLVASLVGTADVVLESGPRRGLRTLALREADPQAWSGVVHVVVTPFGLTGPARDWEADDTVLTAAGGMAWLGGDREGAPEPPPREQGVHLAGTHGAIGALLGLMARQRTGEGQLVEISGQEAVAATLETGAIAGIHGAAIPGRTSGIYGHVAHRVFAAADGHLAGGYSGSPRMWDDLLAWMVEVGEAEDLAEERWADPEFRWAAREHVDEVVARFTARRPAAPFAEEARRRGLPWAEVAGPEELAANPQLLDRRFFTTLETPPGEPPLVDVGTGWESPALPRPVSLGPAVEVRRDQVWPSPVTPEQSVSTKGKSEGALRGGALSGLRVLDLTWVLAGPYVTKTLGEHGADILKVESLHRKDPTRFSPGMRLREGAGVDDGGYFLNFNRNKRSVALNLKDPRAVGLLRDLAAHADVVVENFSPGVLAKWGLDHRSLRELNPDAILVSMAGVGQTGPWRTAVTFADTLAAMSGLTRETGSDTRAPQGLTFGLGDMVAANAAVLATLELLLRGEGGHVDLSQLEAMSSHLGPALLQSQLPAPTGAGSLAPARMLRASGADRWLAVGSHPATPDAAAHRVLELVEANSAARSADEMAAELQAVGIAAYPVRDGRDLVLHDPQLRARGFYVPLTHPLAGEVLHEGIVARLHGTPGALRSPAPLLGEHSDQILREVLALDDTTLTTLHDDGVLT